MGSCGIAIIVDFVGASFMTGLNDAATNFFLKRGVDPETAVNQGVHTGNAGELVFPFYEQGKVVNNKYRAPQKRFWQDKDGVQTWYNHDILLDPTLQTLIVTEGEMDVLTCIEAGYPHVVSPPSGAPNTEVTTEDEDPNGRFHFVYRTWERMKNIPRFIIATDGDEAGQMLAQELVRRFRPHRCLFVTYPEGCKDLNEVMMQHGVGAVREVLDNAKPYPVKGLYRYSDLPPEPPIRPVSTGWTDLDKYFRPFPGQFIVQTGIPGAGKSEWNAAYIANLIRQHGWHCTAGIFEEPPQRFAARVKRAYAGKYPGLLSEQERIELDQIIDHYLSFITQSISYDDDDDMTVTDFLDRADAAILRHGTKKVIMDPWNELDHKREYMENETDYISRAIRQIKRFAKMNEVAFQVTAHPTKVEGKIGLYSISGSAHWANKCDVGLIFERKGEETMVNIKVRKPRFKEATRHGDVHLNFEWQSGRYFGASDTGDKDMADLANMGDS